MVGKVLLTLGILLNLWVEVGVSSSGPSFFGDFPDKVQCLLKLKAP